MNAVVYRFSIEEREFNITLPVGSWPRKIMMQNNVLRLWVEKNKATSIEINYEFRIFYDGEEFDSVAWTYIDSIIYHGGFAAHLYWRPAKV